VGVIFDIFSAEAQGAVGVQNDFEVFEVSNLWHSDADQSRLVAAMRKFRDMVEKMQDEVLR